jgi:hypothetical protein
MQNLLTKLFKAHSHKKALPAPQLVEAFVETLLAILFPAYSVKKIVSKEQLEHYIDSMDEEIEAHEGSCCFEEADKKNKH